MKSTNRFLKGPWKSDRYGQDTGQNFIKMDMWIVLGAVRFFLLVCKKNGLEDTVHTATVNLWLPWMSFIQSCTQAPLMSTRHIVSPKTLRNNHPKIDGIKKITSCRRAAATICPAQACKWWHDIRHVRIWIGHHFCMSMLACQYNQPKRPGDLDLWTLKVVSESRVTIKWRASTSVPIWSS